MEDSVHPTRSAQILVVIDLARISRREARGHKGDETRSGLFRGGLVLAGLLLFWTLPGEPDFPPLGIDPDQPQISGTVEYMTCQELLQPGGMALL